MLYSSNVNYFTYDTRSGSRSDPSRLRVALLRRVLFLDTMDPDFERMVASAQAARSAGQSGTEIAMPDKYDLS